MELRDYLAAVRRFWMTWVGLTLVAVVAALVVVNLLPRTYQATARVFVTSSAESGSASAFLVQRVKSYPDVAVSHAVLGPVVDELGLSTSVQELRRAISATNPPDTSQVHITVQSASASEAADIANAVAMQFTTVVEDLEQPREGNSPVQLTVTDPATAPSAPVSPVPWLILTVGAVLGLGLGLAVAVVRSRLDTAVYNEDDVRRSWGDDAEGLTVHATPPGRGRRSLLTGRPAALLARRLELLAEE